MAPSLHVGLYHSYIQSMNMEYKTVPQNLTHMCSYFVVHYTHSHNTTNTLTHNCTDYQRPSPWNCIPSMHLMWIKYCNKQRLLNNVHQNWLKFKVLIYYSITTTFDYEMWWERKKFLFHFFFIIHKWPLLSPYLKPLVYSCCVLCIIILDLLLIYVNDSKFV